MIPEVLLAVVVAVDSVVEVNNFVVVFAGLGLLLVELLLRVVIVPSFMVELEVTEKLVVELEVFVEVSGVVVLSDEMKPELVLVVVFVVMLLAVVVSLLIEVEFSVSLVLGSFVMLA